MELVSGVGSQAGSDFTDPDGCTPPCEEPALLFTGSESAVTLVGGSEYIMLGISFSTGGGSEYMMLGISLATDF